MSDFDDEIVTQKQDDTMKHYSIITKLQNVIASMLRRIAILELFIRIVVSLRKL